MEKAFNVTDKKDLTVYAEKIVNKVKFVIGLFGMTLAQILIL